MTDRSDRGPDSDREVDLETSTRKWMWAGTILMALFVLMFPIYRIYEPAQRAEAREGQLGFLADQGEELYSGECSSCHGASGRGGIGPAIGSKNFLEVVENEQIGQLINLGVPGTEMVAYGIDNGGPMTSQEIEAIVVYLRSLEEDAESNPLWQTPLAAEDLSGQELYSMACSRCHGTDRMGIEDVAPDISDTSFAMEESNEWIYGRISEGYKEMPRFGRVLTTDQINLLIGFLRGSTSAVTTTTTAPTDTAAPGETTTTTTEAPDGTDAAVLELGKLLFESTAGGRGCASCHGVDAQGTGDGPNIIGASKGAISGALGGGVIDMNDIKLTSEELEAVYQYLRTLSP